MIKNPEEVQRCNEIHNGEFYYNRSIDLEIPT